MDFDVDRALAFENRLVSPRLAGTENERAAGDQIAEEFQAAGLTVERREAIGSRFPFLVVDRVVWVLAAVLGTIVILAPERIAGIWFVPLIVLMILYRFQVFDQLARRLPPAVASPLLVARRASDSERGVRRVVFITSLDSNPPGWSFRYRFGILIFFLYMIYLSAYHEDSRPIPSASRVEDWFVPALWVAAAFVLLTRKRFREQSLVRLFGGYLMIGAVLLVMAMFHWRATHWVALTIYLGAWWLYCLTRAIGTIGARETRGDADNAAGVGMLAEMARTCRLEDVETWFVAAGGRTTDQSGARLLAKIIREESPKKPTLVVNLHDPGRSATLHFVGDDSLHWIVSTSARDWNTPHVEVSAWAFSSLGRFPLKKSDAVESVTLAGDRPDPFDAFGSSKTVGAIRPEMLAATANVAFETASRWARRKPASSKVERVKESQPI